MALSLHRARNYSKELKKLKDKKYIEQIIGTDPDKENTVILSIYFSILNITSYY